MTARKKQRVPRGKTGCLPPIPAFVHSPLGDVPVEFFTRENSSSDAGAWMPRDRIIRLADDLAPAALWQVFCHEKIHMWLDDAGANLGEEIEERVCEIGATAIVSEMIAHAPTKPVT